jgi:hypothetical protein
VRGHHGAVVDFIALHFWPTFNVADSCIVIGAIAAAVIVSSPKTPPGGADPGPQPGVDSDTTPVSDGAS